MGTDRTTSTSPVKAVITASQGSEQSTYKETGRGREELVAGGERTFRAVKLFRVVLSWWLPIVIHLSKPTVWTRVNPNVNYDFN